MKHPTPSHATDVLTGDDEQNGKQKRTKRKKQGVVPNPATLDHSVASYDAQGSYGEPIHFNPPPSTQGYIYLFIIIIIIIIEE